MKIEDIHTRNCLPKFLNTNSLNTIGAEVGVLRGNFSKHILRHWRDGVLYSIDPWKRTDPMQGEKLYTEAKTKLGEFKERSIILRKTSEQASLSFKDGSLDFCYIDASHKYHAVKLDIKLWWLKVKEGGVLCGHDYGINEKLWLQRNPKRKSWPHKETKKAVDEFIDENSVKVYIDIPNGIEPTSWYIIK